MSVESPVRDFDAVELWRAGQLDRWVRRVIIAACLVTVVLAAAGPRVLWMQDTPRRHLNAFWFRDGLACVLGFWIVVSALPGWKLARWLRVAVLLPLAHLIAIVVAWRMWQIAEPALHLARRASPLVDRLSPGTTAPWLALVTFLGALAIAKRRRETRDAVALIALGNLLVLGLWLPIAATCLSWRARWGEHGMELDDPAQTIGIVIVPPMLCALAFAAFAMRAPQRLVVWRKWLAWSLGIAIVLGAGHRIDGSDESFTVYSNFIPALLSAALVAIGALFVLGAASWREPARSRGRIEGTIADDEAEDVVAAFQIAGWLRGPRAIARAFTLRTEHGDLPVPAGAALVAPVPATTTRVKVGESVAVLRRGDRIFVDGFVSPRGGAPFRDLLAPIPGPHGLSIGPVDAPSPDFGHVALVTWRPAVAYLLILLAISVPALAGLLGS